MVSKLSTASGDPTELPPNFNASIISPPGKQQFFQEAVRNPTGFWHSLKIHTLFSVIFQLPGGETGGLLTRQKAARQKGRALDNLLSDWYHS
jgi:hypothetical protein